MSQFACVFEDEAEPKSTTLTRKHFIIGCEGGGKQKPRLDLSGSAKPGGSAQATLSSGKAQAPTLLILGFDNRAPYPLPLPFAGCNLYHTVDATRSTMSDTAGGAAVGVPIPNLPQLIGQKFYTQFFQIEISPKALGLRASPYGRILIG